MRGHARSAFAGILMVGLIAAPALSSAADRDGNKHSLIHHPNKPAVEQHQPHQYQGGLPHFLEELKLEVANLKNQVKTLTDRLNNGAGSTPTTPPPAPPTNPVLTDLAKYVKIDPGVVNGVKGPHVIFSGVNLHVESGSGTTAEGGAPTGLGNLIVGYNEMPMPTGGSRIGSHNLVVGPSHAFTSTGGAVFGDNNLISGQSATILGGNHNSATGPNSSILGGFRVVVSDTEATYP